MARSFGVIKSEVWEPRSGFRKLTPGGQWAYLMLVSQPQISNLGLLAYTPEKWARLATSLTERQLEDWIAELSAAYYVLLDIQTGELLIRTFVRHDKVWAQPALVANGRILIRAVESDEIHDYLVGEHPWLDTDRWFDGAPVFADGKERLAWDRGRIESHESQVSKPKESSLHPSSSHAQKEGSQEDSLENRHRPQVQGPGSRSRTNSSRPSSTSRSERANGNGHGPAAADLEAARETDIVAAVEKIHDHDQGSLDVVLPIAAQLPAELFHEVTSRHATKRKAGVGLYVRLLRLAAAEHQARANATALPTLEEEILFDARSYARGQHPWTVAEDLLGRKLARRANGEQALALMDAAADAFAAVLAPEVTS